MAISCLGFNTIALFSRQIFKNDDAPVNVSLIFWFCFAEMICSVPRNSPMADYQNIWLTSKHSEPIGTIRTLAYGPTQKSPPSVQAVFQVASAPISSRFLCPRPPLLLSAPNQNRQATQANTDRTSSHQNYNRLDRGKTCLTLGIFFVFSGLSKRENLIISVCCFCGKTCRKKLPKLPQLKTQVFLLEKQWTLKDRSSTLA